MMGWDEKDERKEMKENLKGVKSVWRQAHNRTNNRDQCACGLAIASHIEKNACMYA
jgi:hypothetical protein